MQYGFDLWEWVTEDDLRLWHEYMSAHMGWQHLLGARASKNQLDQIYEGLDFSSYEQHKPDYLKYVETIDARPDKPSFSEDRFRMQNPARAKDYTMEETRRGLWHSSLAGGIANIWGNLLSGGKASDPYPRPEWIRTNATFFTDRFFADMERCNTLSDGLCLQRPGLGTYVFYREDATSIRMDLSGMSGPRSAIAVDAALPYAEFDLGNLPAADQSWTAPYLSDWAIAVGFSGSAPATVRVLRNDAYPRSSLPAIFSGPDPCGAPVLDPSVSLDPFGADCTAVAGDGDDDDMYLDAVTSPLPDPEAGIVGDPSRPLVFYQIDRVRSIGDAPLRLVKTAAGDSLILSF